MLWLTGGGDDTLVSKPAKMLLLEGGGVVAGLLLTGVGEPKEVLKSAELL